MENEDGTLNLEAPTVDNPQGVTVVKSFLRHNAWRAGRKAGSKSSRINKSDNEGGKIAVKADSRLSVPERDDPAYKKFSEMVGGKEGLLELASWSENPKAKKLCEVLDSDKYKNYGIKALARRCGMTLPELCNLFREKHFLETFITFFQGVPEIAKGAVEDASPSTDMCPVCSGFKTIKRGEEEVLCPKCEGTGKIRLRGDKEARRDVFKAVGLLKDSPAVINQQIGNVTVEGLDNFEELMKTAAKTAKKVDHGTEQEIQEAEIIEEDQDRD
jgi:hypothetical protein